VKIAYVEAIQDFSVDDRVLRTMDGYAILPQRR